jgi:hypothetical protein
MAHGGQRMNEMKHFEVFPMNDTESHGFFVWFSGMSIALVPDSDPFQCPAVIDVK